MTETTRPYAPCERVSSCCATVNVVSSAPTSRRTYNSPQPLHPTTQSSSSIDFVTPKINPFLSHLLSLSLSLSLCLPPSGPIIPLSAVCDQEVSFQAPLSPGLVRFSVTVSQPDVCRRAEAVITVTDSLDAPVGPCLFNARGLPGYTVERAAGELWPSRS